MPKSEQQPSVRRRRLGAELRRLRERAGLTLEDAAEHLNRSRSRVSRWETGQAVISKADAEALLELYEVIDYRVRDSLLRLVRDVRRVGWWRGYQELLTPSYFDLISLEAGAQTALAYESLLVPGLLQVPEYTRLVAATPVPMMEREVADLVDVRTNRQKRLREGDSPLELVAIIEEAVLRRPKNEPAVLREQLQHLVAVSELPNVSLHVLPEEVGMHPAVNGPFTILQFEEKMDMDLVCLENATSSLYVEEPKDVRVYRDAFSRVRSMAMSADESVRAIKASVEEYVT